MKNDKKKEKNYSLCVIIDTRMGVDNMICPGCGANIPDSASFCSYCGKKIERLVVESTVNNNIKEVKNENVFLGLIGGLIGSLAGVASIVLLSRIGFVASIAGLVMAICTIKLYEKFAGSISKKGIIICIVITLLMTLLAENISFAWQVVRELDAKGYKGDFFDIFFNLYKYMGEGYFNNSTYFTNLGLVYLFNIIGAFSLFKTQLGITKK